MRANIPRRTRAKPSQKMPDLEPIFTDEQCAQASADYEEHWGTKRRIIMIALTRTPAQLVEGFRHIEGEAFNELLAHFEDMKAHGKALVELAECAEARMLLVGSYIVETSETEVAQ